MSDTELSSTQPSSEDELNEENRKIVCCDNRLLIDACQHISREVEDFVAERVPSEPLKRVLARFEELYSTVIRENVSIREMLSDSYNQQSQSQKRKSKSKVVNENLLPKLGEVLVELLEKRKRYPYHCCEILLQSLKEERKNLRVGPKSNFTSDSSRFSWNERNNEFLYVEQKLASDFELLNRFNQKVETEIDKVKKLEEDILAAKNIYHKEKQRIMDIFYDPNRNVSYKDETKCIKKICLPPSLLGKLSDEISNCSMSEEEKLYVGAL